ncbi:MAG: glycine zipper 2TM domain-containing protein [Candidatus Omnitrophica bacterium]|nr:glycine zipper 2TM domain-containing protein [Candidatus Omnitrophota bacterium]
MMNKNAAVFITGITLAFFTLGCQSAKTNAVEGAVIGGLIGAGAGGIIGHQSHHGAEGAGIGLAAGALTGAIVGSQIEKKPAQNTTTGATQNPNQMTIAQIVDLTKQGAHPAVIVDRIKLTNSKFNLTENDVQYLKQEGVNQQVIDAMRAN